MIHLSIQIQHRLSNRPRPRQFLIAPHTLPFTKGIIIL
ncbi:hypothetical protein COXBURSA331_A0209 [Coxiella burnetii RSA 331]|nr:hypothetical protein COXBURSA331_A0209 [Coxiella burnetii RSA 331]EDR36527.1 hypothetical protein COXBURSA334_1963 [Coxiella burnetii Q321]